MALGNMLETGEKGDKTLVIDRYSNDYDLKTGICGMASGVMEWTSSMEKDPARVKEPPGPVALRRGLEAARHHQPGGIPALPR